MNQKPVELPLRQQTPHVTQRAETAGPMTMQCMEFAAGYDMAPMLEGLPGDLCSVPHWGFVLEGTLIVREGDGPENRIPEGHAYYLAPGHTIRFDERTRYLDFSPNDAMAVLGAHIQRKLAAQPQLA